MTEDSSLTQDGAYSVTTRDLRTCRWRYTSVHGRHRLLTPHSRDMVPYTTILVFSTISILFINTAKCNIPYVCSLEYGLPSKTYCNALLDGTSAGGFFNGLRYQDLHDHYFLLPGFGKSTYLTKEQKEHPVALPMIFENRKFGLQMLADWLLMVFWLTVFVYDSRV